MIDLSIIIVSYNTRDFVSQCLASIHDTVKEYSFEVFVVDNASTDDSVKVVGKYIENKQYKNMHLIAYEKNLGFSKANNVGVKRARGRYVLFLNPDTVIRPETIDYLIKYMDKEKSIGALTCRLNMPNGQIDDASHRGFPTPWNSLTHFFGLPKLFPGSRVFGGYNMGWKDLKSAHEIDALAGAFMLVRRDAGEQVGWWDEDYFFYGEDLQFCFDLRQKGWKIMYVPEVSILHYKGVSGGIKKVSKEITTATKDTKKRVTKARFDAMRIFYKKNYEKQNPRLLSLFVDWGISVKQYLSSR